MSVTLGLWLLCLSLSSTCSLDLPPVLDITRLESENPDCHKDLRALQQGLDDGQLWAQTMWDAGVKAPVGLLSQTAIQFGDFDECLTVTTPVTAQYCMVDVSPVVNNSSWAPLKWGTCVPASCSAKELQNSLETFMKNEAGLTEKFRVDVSPELCTTKETSSKSITLAGIIYCVVMVSIVLTVCFATVHDIRQKPVRNGTSSPESLNECFSARNGLYSLITIEDPFPGINLRPFYGLHTCTALLVVTGHRLAFYLFPSFIKLTNYRSIENIIFGGSWLSIWLCHKDLLVEIFFFMSSFFLSLSCYADLQKHCFNPFIYYFKRLCRVVPAYAVVVFFYATLLGHLGDGPLWNLFMGVEQEKCRNYWWTNMFFINIYFRTENLCISQSWYLSCDFQLFVFGVLLVLLYHYKPRVGTMMTVVTFLVSIFSRFLGTYLYNWPVMFLIFTKDITNRDAAALYMQAHYRVTSYLPGLIAGWYVYKHRKDRITKGVTYALQVVGITCSLLVFWSGTFFYNPYIEKGRLISAIYAALFQTMFGIGLALFAISFTLGQSTWVSQFLSWRGFVPLSKLSYCVYLVHFIPQLVWIGSSRTAVYLNPLEMISWTITDVIISLFFALLINLIVETPVRYMVKYMSTGPPSKSSKNKEMKDK